MLFLDQIVKGIGFKFKKSIYIEGIHGARKLFFLFLFFEVQEIKLD